MSPPLVRPMEARDIDAVYHVSVAAFQDLSRRFGEEPEPPAPIAEARVRVGHLRTTDPGGAWVAERRGEVVGASLGILREGVWGLSLLVVRPDAQSSGAGRELLDRAYEYGMLDERGYAVVRTGAVRLLAATDEAGAATLLRACLAAAGAREASVEWITSAQGWALTPCLDAGLELRMNGAVFLAGDVGPFAPYLPSGAYL